MTADEATLKAGLAAIDAAHRADPQQQDGAAAEQVYAERLWAFIQQLVPEPSPALRLAARAQHLERWAIPRASFPMDRVGYLRWRRAVHQRQGERVEAILTSAGLDADLAKRVRTLVAKAAAKEPDGQALEDAACLVFLAHEFEAFAQQHADYTAERVIGIIRKTWAKMTEAGHALALTNSLPPHLSRLVEVALRQAPSEDDE